MQISQTIVPPKLEMPIEPVTNSDVIKVLNLHQSKAFLKKRLEQVEADLDSVESDLIVRIEAGARIESRHPVSVKVSERRYPSWKDAFTKMAGESEAKKVIDSTLPKVSKSIVISAK